MDPAHRSTHCHNCGEPLTGPYCAACGQKDQERILPLGHLLHEVFHEFSHLDQRFLGTLRMLLRPGALTLEYLAGRRARWVPPFRLYLLVSLAFFALSVFRPASKDFRITVNPPAGVAALDGKPLPASPTRTRLAKKAEEINRDPTAFLAKLYAWLPRVAFVLLPVFALLLKLAYLRTRTLYSAHAIFSLHQHAFAFLLFTTVSLLSHVPYVRSLRVLLFLALPVHLVLGLKRVYGQGWLLTSVKAAVVGVLHLLTILAVLVGTTLMLLLLT